MLSSAIRAILPILACSHLALLLWLSLPDINACSSQALPAGIHPRDIETAAERSKNGALFYLASFLDVIGIVYIILNSRKCASRHDLQGHHRWVPVLSIMSMIAFRSRYLYCASTDAECCANLKCPETTYAADFEGCSDLARNAIIWSERENWCPVPKWYDQSGIVEICGGLHKLPDVASCYRYGCSTQAPVRYYGNRVIMWSSVLFALLSLVPYEPRAPRIEQPVVDKDKDQ